MKKLLIFLAIFIAADSLNSFAQFSRYVIQLKNKSGTPYSISNPTQFLSPRAIDRRTRYSISIDSRDLPVVSAYLDSIRLSGNVTILNVSKWFNQVCIKTTDAAALTKINSFSFVAASAPIAARFYGLYQPINKELDPDNIPVHPTPVRPVIENVTDFYSYGDAYAQIHVNNGEFLHDHGFKGEGMLMAVTDAGFYHYLSLPTFDSVRNNNQILGTWDFVANAQDVNNGSTHGMDCFSTIAANMPGVFIGTAPKTSFYLYVTEDISSEYPVEEQNWVAAAEKADSLGVDVISVSLGYNTFDNSLFDYTYNDMNGHSTLIAKAANLATEKGMLVVAAAGNSGNDSWHYIDTPGDADSVLTVGAVDIYGEAGTFSSYGPNSSGQTKPDVAAVGWNTVLADPVTGQPVYNSGTSFSTPIMAGLSTCLWQAFPEANSMSIIEVLRKAADRAGNPDDRTGYGIPDLKKAFVELIKKLHTQQAAVSNCKATISWEAKSATDMNFVIERKLSSDIGYHAIDTLSAKSNFVKNNFTYSDNLSLLPSGTSAQYRIKMNIASDTSFYLDSATLDYPASCSPVIAQDKIIISPNPAADNLSVMVTRNSLVNVSVVLYSMNGQRVFSTGNQQEPGSQIYTIPMKKLSKGVYYLSVFIDNKEAASEKIMH